MTAALRLRVWTVAAAFRNSTAFSEPLSCRRYYSSSLLPQSLRRCAPAAEALLFDAADTVLPKVEMAPLTLQRRVLVYDGVCHLCHNGVKWIIKADKDKKIKFCCLQSKAAELYMEICGVEREDVLRRFVFVEGPGSYHEGSTAALRVVSYLPLPYSALSGLMVVPPPLRDAVYDYVAQRRYGWFGKEDDCLVLKETELLERFIDWEELLERSRLQQQSMR